MAVATQSGKVMLLKTAWSEFYDGDPITGNFDYIKEHGPKSGHEKYNFSPRDGMYRGYCPPPGPKPADRTGWTVIWVAKKPGTSGIRVVGVYYDASITSEYVDYIAAGEQIYYRVTAKSALFIPPELRSEAFPSPVRSGSCCYLQIPGTPTRYPALLSKLLRFIEAAQRNVRIEDLEDIAPQFFPDSAKRREVEQAAVGFITRLYEKDGYKVTSREPERVGFDLEARRGKSVLRLEVKGTAGAVPYAYITSNERGAALEDQDATWLMCIVTDALGKPKLHRYTSKEFFAAFSLDPMCYRAVLK